MIKRAKQPAGQMPRHDCHGVHPNQTHEEWLASMQGKQANVSNILASRPPDISGLLGDVGIGGAAGGAVTLNVPDAVRTSNRRRKVGGTANTVDNDLGGMTWQSTTQGHQSVYQERHDDIARANLDRQHLMLGLQRRPAHCPTPDPHRLAQSCG